MKKVKMKKYKIYKKNEGSWIKWSVVDKNNIVRFVGIAKEAKQFLKKLKEKL